MKKSLITMSLLAGLMCSSAFADPFNNQQYGVQIDKPAISSIQDFKVTGDNFNPGSVIKFVVDGESEGQASVKFISSGKISRTVQLKETEPGLYTGQYTVRSLDQLQGKTFTTTLVDGKTKYVALYSPVAVYSRNIVSKPVYKNPDFGSVSMVEVKEVVPTDINYGSTAIGAVVGGVLGNQVGGGNGKKAAAVLGAIAGGVAGNQIGKNMTKQNVWNVHVTFEDGQTNIYQFNQDPQISNGALVRKDGQTIVRR